MDDEVASERCSADEARADYNLQLSRRFCLVTEGNLKISERHDFRTADTFCERTGNTREARKFAGVVGSGAPPPNRRQIIEDFSTHIGDSSPGIQPNYKEDIADRSNVLGPLRMPRTKRKKAATEDRTVTRKRRVSAGHEPNSEVNTDPTTCKAPFASETNMQTGRNGDSGVDHADQAVGAAAAPQESLPSSDENKSDDDRGINDAAVASQGTNGEYGTPTVAASRKERIRQMVEHRKQLLHRVRLGRTSVVKRIATQPASNITDEQEIARFHDMIKTVNAEIRKQQQLAQQIQKQQQDTVDRRSAARRGSAAQKRGSAVSTVASPEDLEISMRTDATAKTKRSVVSQPAPKRRVVICAETAALRERRNALLAKLKCPPAKNPTPLPQRRQTHWDTLLQEMAWTATDFREERKWKVVAARWTGYEIVQQAANPMKCSSGASSQASNASVEPDQGIACIEQPQVVAEAKEETENVPEVVSEPSDTALEEDPTIDEAELRQSSSMLSRSVVDFLQGKAEKEPQHDKDEEMSTSSAPADATTDELQTENPSEYVDRILESMKKDLQNERRSRSEAYGQKLTEHQVQAVRAVEDRWHRVRVGACLRGPVSAGKTITACSLLWRHRAQGISLVICKLENVVCCFACQIVFELFPHSCFLQIRWIHELGRFSDLKPYVWDPVKTASTSSNANVLVCTHATVCQISVEQLKRFHTIVVDKRYPNGFCGSRLAVENEDISTKAPLEFADIEWWTKLASTSSNRVVVEKSEPSFGFLRNASNRQRLSILALYMGFLLGTQVFESKRFVLEKSILAWGRHQIKNKGQANESKYQRIYTLFTSICDAFHCQVEGKETLESSIATSDAWDVRQCDMSQKQADAYFRACSDVRSTLSGSVPCGDDATESRCIAGAFMQLRKHVFHADLSDSIQCLQPAVVRGSASQPDLVKARKIMACSGKLQALVSIIVQEFQYRFNNGSGDVRFLFDEHKFKRVKPSSVDVHRLVILASHPDILAVVSGLLSLIGIEHDLLSSGVGGSQNEGRTVHSQLLLSKFNGETKISSEASPVQKILVAAPCAIATDFGGLGVEKADAVLLLDEDWSGAEELVLQALSTRCNFQRTSSELEPCRFIRLVSKGTCESRLLEQSNVSDISSHTPDSSAKQFWVFPVAPSGRYVAPELLTRGKGNLNEMYRSRPLSPGTFSFPGFTLFCLAGSPLHDVLGDVQESPPSALLSQEEMLYCPRDALGQRMQTVCSLQQEEHRSMLNGSTRSFGSVHFSCWEQRGTVFSQLYTGKLPCREFLRHAFGGEDAVESYEPLPSNLTMPMSTKSSQTQTQSSIAQLQRGDVALNQPIQTKTAVAESVLFYMPPSQLPLSPNTRANLFAASFGADRQESIIFDGNQGSEPLVYFPPLFPRIRECGVLARRDVSALQSQMYPIPIQVEDVGAFPSGADSSKSMEQTDVHRVVTEDEASRSDAASVLIDISDDFGLVGMGAVPLPRDSALAASNQASATHSSFQNVPTSYSWGDFQEMGQTVFSGSNSIVLLTSRKRQRKHAPAAVQQLPRGSMNGSYAAPIATLPPIQEGATKKFKAGPVPLSRPSFSGVSMVSHASAKDVRLHSLLNNLRQYGRGSMFEAPIYRVASVRVRNKIADRLLRGWEGAAFEAGPGLPLMVYKQHPGAAQAYRGLFDVDSNLWTSIVKRLSSKEAVTGGEAVELSIGQRSSLRRSLVSPCRVDFGPFQSGFVSSTTGATVGAPQRSRVGVSLPMGVKIPPSGKDQLPLPWTQDEDRRLHEAAVRTGMNWILTAAELSGFKDITIAAKSESRNYHLSRSARTCRDRWQRLARNNPAMVVKVRQSERYWSSFNQFPENDGDSGTCVPVQGDDNTTLLARSTKRNKEPVSSKSRTFHAVLTAKTRRQTALPLQIPGVAPGAQPTTSPPHQSHEQAIKTSVAASWTGVRTDMWPLHLLDAADRADAAARHSTRTGNNTIFPSIQSKS